MNLSPAQKSHFFHELAKLLRAGFGIRKAADVLLETHLPPKQAGLLRTMSAALAEGKTIAQAFDHRNSFLNELDLSLISVGERGGKLDASFQHLGDYYDMLARFRREFFGSMMYPLAMLNLGAIVGGAVPKLMAGGSMLEMIGGVLLQLGILYVGLAAVAFLVWFLIQQAKTSTVIDGILCRLPILGKFRTHVVLARFTRIAHTCVLAGIGVPEMVEALDKSSDSALWRKSMARLKAAAEEGDFLGPQMMESPVFPSSFARSYYTAEQAGGLDHDLERWSIYFRDEALSSGVMFAKTLSKLIYIGMLVYVGWTIVSLSMEQSGDMEKAMEDI
jgi:type IV pilus assembly protein PilC